MPQRPIRLFAAALLVAEALLLTHPVLMVSNYFNGAGILGKAVAFVRVFDVYGQGLAYVSGLLTFVLLLLAAWGVAHKTRGIGAMLLQPIVLAFVSVPFLRQMSTLDARVLLVVMVLTVGALIVLIGTTSKDTTKHRRWWVLAVFVAGTAILAGMGAGSRSFPYDPTVRLADLGMGSQDKKAADVPVPDAPQNPSLAANPFNNIHNDSWATDAYSLKPPAKPETADVETLFTGGDCASITFDSQGRLVTLCSTLSAVIAYVVDPETLEVLEQRQVGNRSASVTDFSGGGYFILDSKDRIVFPARGGQLRLIATTPGLPEVDAIDVTGTLTDGEQVTSVMPDWQGRYWYVGSLGTVGVARKNGKVDSLNLGGEDIENSLAVTREGAYVVTGAALYRIVVGSEGPPVVAWRTDYARGSQRKPGQTSRASGTTPTVFGDWVAITDNDEPRMNVLVANRYTGNVVCELPVFAANRSATENSLIAVDGALIVENNYGYYPAITSTTAGGSTEPGVAAVGVAESGCGLRWENNGVHVPSLVSKATSRTGLVLTYTKPPSDIGVDAWYFTGLDVETGEVRWMRLAGTGTIFNNHYAGAYLSADGDMYVGTINGIVVLRAK